jgi:transketolase
MLFSMTSTLLAESAGSSAAPTLGYSDLQRLLSLQTGDEKHGPSATSTLDVIWVLYDKVLDVSPTTVADDDRDRFYLSKGHGPMAYYAVLAAKGFFPVDWLATFGEFDSALGHHPDRNLVPGVEISSGSLGHGLPLAVGTALGLRARLIDSRVVCLVGDAELDEGTNAEAIAFAGAVGLANLTVVVIDNRSSSLGWRGGIATRFEVESWSAMNVDGRNHAELETGLAYTDARQPTVVVAEVEDKA